MPRSEGKCRQSFGYILEQYTYVRLKVLDNIRLYTLTRDVET